MSQYLDKVRDVDPNDSEAVKEAITAFFQNLSKYKTSHCDQWLRALENCINRFPKYCGQHRATIENYLVNFLNSTNYYSVILAAKCAHSLQQVRPPQEKTATAKSSWREQMLALCDAAHSLIDTLFPRNTNHNWQKETTQSNTSQFHLALEDVDSLTETEDVTNKSAILTTRLRNILVFIQAMLVEIYPVAKPIRPQLILEVILRALSASGNEDSESIAIGKTQALRTLDALVACLGSNLIPFSSLVFRFVLQTLRWSSDNVTKHSRKVRITAYNSLTQWLTSLRTHRPPTDSRAHAWDAELTSHVLRDVTPDIHLIQLTANSQPMKNLSKKARKKLTNSMLKQSNMSTHMPGEKNKIHMSEESNDEVAIAALECAEAFLTTCGIFLKPTIHKQFQEVLVKECYNIDNISIDRAMSLLRTLEACRKTCTVPPTQYCLQLYSTLINCSQIEVSKFCSQALLDIRLHLHCSPPSLNFAVEAQPNETKKDDSRKRMSERNRAVLENLLGKERMPSEVIQEEVITIPDEPSTKRSRLEDDVSEKISLSSASEANSIEISDDSGPEVEETTQDNFFIDVRGDTNGVEEINSPEISILSTVPEENAEDLDQSTQNSATEKESSDDIEPLTQKSPSNRIHELDTQVAEKQEIFYATTQMPLQISNDTVDGEKSPVSMEVAYDYPNTAQDKVSILEKIDHENLPSSVETDDIQITCGQQVKSSPDVDCGKIKGSESNLEETPKVNGIDKSPEPILENGKENEEINLPSKLPSNDGEVTVEDMLADFVDEVNDDSQITA